MCFSVDQPDSLENISAKWNPEVTHFCSGVPKLVIALKLDLRNDEKTINDLKALNQEPVTKQEVRFF